MLLAVRIHRAVRIIETGNGQQESWVRYFGNYFPTGRNGAEDAKLLRVDWRTSLLKDETPGHGVAITHGQPPAHWLREGGTQALCINLESMWDDFEASVEKAFRYLRTDSERQKIAVERWRSRLWTVRQLNLVPLPLSFSTSAAYSATAMAPPNP